MGEHLRQKLIELQKKERREEDRHKGMGAKAQNRQGIPKNHTSSQTNTPLHTSLVNKINMHSENLNSYNAPDSQFSENQIQQILSNRSSEESITEALKNWSIPYSTDLPEKLEKSTHFSMDAGLKRIYSILSCSDTKISEKKVDREAARGFKNPWEPMLLEGLVENLSSAELKNLAGSGSDIDSILMLDFYAGLIKNQLGNQQGNPNQQANQTLNSGADFIKDYSNKALVDRMEKPFRLDGTIRLDKTLQLDEIVDKIKEYFFNADPETLKNLGSSKTLSNTASGNGSASTFPSLHNNPLNSSQLATDFDRTLPNPKYVVPASFYFSRFKQWFREYKIEGISDKMGLKALVFFSHLIYSKNSAAKAFEVLKPHLKADASNNASNIYTLISDTVKFSTFAEQIGNLKDTLAKYILQSEGLRAKIKECFGSTEELVENLRLLMKLPDNYSFPEILDKSKAILKNAEYKLSEITNATMREYLDSKSIEKLAAEFEDVSRENKNQIKEALSVNADKLLGERWLVMSEFQNRTLDSLEKISELKDAYSRINAISDSLRVLRDFSRDFDRSFAEWLNGKIVETVEGSSAINSKIVRNLDAIQQKERLTQCLLKVEKALADFDSRNHPAYNGTEYRKWDKQFSFLNELKNFSSIAQKCSSEKFADYQELSETHERFSTNLQILKKKISYSVTEWAEGLKKLLEDARSDYSTKTWDIQKDLGIAKSRKVDVENIKQIYNAMKVMDETSEETQVKIRSMEPQILEMEGKLAELTQHYTAIAEKVGDLKRDIANLDKYSSITARLDSQKIGKEMGEMGLENIREMLTNLLTYGSKYISTDHTEAKYLENAGLQDFIQRSSEIYRDAMQTLALKADFLEQKVKECHEKLQNANFFNSFFLGGVSAVRRRIAREMDPYNDELSCTRALLKIK